MWPFTGFRRRSLKKPDGHGPPISIPTMRELTTSEKLLNAVNQKALLHPLTLYPFVIGAAAAAWSGMIDFSQASFFLALGGLLGGPAHYFYTRFFRGDKLAEKYVRECQELVKSLRDQKVERLKLTSEDCDAEGFEEGRREADEVTRAYEALDAYLMKQETNQRLDIPRWRDLAEETFLEAMGLISQALALFVGLEQIDAKKLKREKKALEAKLAELGKSDFAERDAAEKQLKACSGRIEQFEQNEKRVQLLIAQANDLESALQTALMEVAQLPQSGSSVILTNGESATRLEIAVRAARRVEERLRNLSSLEESESDREYFEKGISQE